MTRVTRALGAVSLLALGGCDDLVGFGGVVPPLTTIQVRTTGDFEAVRIADDASLHVALVWGEQWLPEALCFLPPETDEVTAVVLAGCRNPFSFTPDRVAANLAIEPGLTGELALFELPSADVMIGDLTARIAYASLVVYDDRDGDGTLDLARPTRLPGGGFEPEENRDDLASEDIIYGASFVAMTEPDTRLAFREGGFTTTAFYPRAGCGDPLPSFSLLSAGGFSIFEAIAATERGELPMQDPATCRELAPDMTIVSIPFVAPEQVREVGCEQRQADSSVRYRQPPAEPLDLADRAFACAAVPDFGAGTTTGIIQLVVASHPDDTCRGLAHYTLRGCDEGALDCASPEWDFTATPPSWWPCPAGGIR